MDRNNQLTLFQATHNNHEIEYTDLPEYNNVNEAEAKITLTGGDKGINKWIYTIRNPIQGKLL